MTNIRILFRQGEDGYPVYRIPALLTIPGGRTLFFAEGRANGMADYGKIDIVMKISTDGCQTFSAQRTIASCGKDTIGNPCPVYDRVTGRIWLFLNTNLADGPEWLIMQNKAPRGVGCIYSDDLGETWSEFCDLTAVLKPEGWTWYATGPCHGLQLENGRLIIPCNHGVFDREKGNSLYYQSHVIISDDHGATWRLGGTVEGVHGNETVAEMLADGTVYLNSRNIHDRPYRLVAFSKDGGDSWYDAHEDENLPDPMCQACVIAYPKPYEGCARPLLFSNNPNKPGPDSRRNLRVRLSLDNGKSWPRSMQVHDGCTAYADMTCLDDGSVGILYECGDSNAYECIAFRTFTPDDLK